MRNDKEVVIEAIKQNPYSFKYAYSDLKNDAEFVEEASKINPKILQHAGKDLKIFPKPISYESIKYKYVFDFECEETKNELNKLYNKNKIDNEKDFSMCLNTDTDKRSMLLLGNYLYSKKDLSNSVKYYLALLPTDNADVYKKLGAL